MLPVGADGSPVAGECRMDVRSGRGRDRRRDRHSRRRPSSQSSVEVALLGMHRLAGRPAPLQPLQCRRLPRFTASRRPELARFAVLAAAAVHRLVVAAVGRRHLWWLETTPVVAAVVALAVVQIVLAARGDPDGAHGAELPLSIGMLIVGGTLITRASMLRRQQAAPARGLHRARGPVRPLRRAVLPRHPRRRPFQAIQRSCGTPGRRCRSARGRAGAAVRDPRGRPRLGLRGRRVGQQSSTSPSCVLGDTSGIKMAHDAAPVDSRRSPPRVPVRAAVPGLLGPDAVEVTHRNGRRRRAGGSPATACRRTS